MRLVVPFPVVPEGAPFTNDKLKREPFANSLTNLVHNLEDPSVITIDAPWGEGKTTFAKMWLRHLKNKGCHCIYLDAFANDYLDDPFIVIVGEIVSYIKENYSTEHPIYSEVESLLKKASRAGAKLLGFGVKIGLKAATLGALDKDDIKGLEEIKEAIANDSFDFANNLFEKKLRDHRDDAASIEDFKNTLSEFAASIKKDTSYPLILMVDELDRCRPTYAVDFIEKIKHLFSVENVVFTLILNKKQLAAAVSSIYGEKIEATTYLQKFFTIETTLPKNEDIIDNDYRTFCNHVYEKLGIDAGNDVSSIQSTMIGLSEIFCLSLRDVEKCYSLIALFYGAKGRSFNLSPLVSLLAIVKVKFPEIYASLGSATRLNRDEGKELLNKLYECRTLLEKHKIHRIIQIFAFCTMSEEQYQNINSDSKDITKYEDKLWHYTVSRTDVIPLIAKQLNLFNIS